MKIFDLFVFFKPVLTYFLLYINQMKHASYFLGKKTENDNSTFFNRNHTIANNCRILCLIICKKILFNLKL